jgi:hypothetical protein
VERREPAKKKCTHETSPESGVSKAKRLSASYGILPTAQLALPRARWPSLESNSLKRDSPPASPSPAAGGDSIPEELRQIKEKQLRP